MKPNPLASEVVEELPEGDWSPGSCWGPSLRGLTCGLRVVQTWLGSSELVPEMGCLSGPSPLPPGATPAHTSCSLMGLLVPEAKERGRTSRRQCARGAKTAGNSLLQGALCPPYFPT